MYWQEAPWVPTLLCSFLTAELKMQAGDWPSLMTSLQPKLESVPTELLRVQGELILPFFLFLTDAQQNNLDRDGRRLIMWTARHETANLFKLDKIYFQANHSPKQNKCWNCPLWKGNALIQSKKSRKKHFSPWIFKYSFLQNKERERGRAWVPAKLNSEGGTEG